MLLLRKLQLRYGLVLQLIIHNWEFFGCTAYAHVDNGKLEPRAIKSIFLGYKSSVKGYKLWNPQTKKVIISRNIIFNESAMLHDNLATNTPIEKTSVQVEYSIDSAHIPENKNIAVQNAPIAENS